ncbi:two-component system response regulator YesN [Paenibacillus shirakamiensis]|uniref:Two-component system response regulator YesN n=1 Tax=Paenibacillus shirakamiensis TaxID=1265935 RepID=A0ABS4JEW5_9BACL|nr:response regulator [Paenibacillus shirakamiensis]MBP1999615.1 two-component system response regulator YesN [Paenibacillus shirakamiensis]
MYKLILVDDESDVREGLLHEIDWNSWGFEVIETAENGCEAMEMIERFQPDVVVTDIQMPFMNGLELSAWIREHYPATKIIILTGFEEFEYAQRAVKLQIDEYILKPFSSRELIDILLKVRAQIDQEVSFRENVYTLTEHYRQNLPVLQSIFLSSLITRRLNAQDIEEKCSHYNIYLEGAIYVVSCLRIDSGSQHQESESGKRVDSVSSLLHSSDQDLQLYAVLNIAQEITDKYEAGYTFIHHDEVIVIHVHKVQEEISLAEINLTMLEEILHSVDRYLKLTVTAGAGRVKRSIQDLPSSYKESVQALDYRLILGGNKVFWIEDMDNRTHQPLELSAFQDQELGRCLKLGTEEEINLMMDQLFDKINASGTSSQEFRIYLLEILTCVIKSAKEIHVDLDRLFGDGDTGVTEISKFTHSSEAKEWFRDIGLRLRSSIAMDRQSSYSKLVDEAQEYIRHHYRDSELSISRVCSVLHISTGYFSNIFKKEKKMTFVQYLMTLRMEAAQELLQGTDMKAFEIAEHIGFSDPNYFSFCFRKKYGISPKDYRSGIRES